MAITVTVLQGAITSQQTSLGVLSATGITAPNNQTGVGITILQIDQEQMLVTTAPNGTAINSLVRGWNSTPAQAHKDGSQVQIGGPSDFPTVSALWPNPNVQTNSISAAQTLVSQWLAGLTDAIPLQAGNYTIKSVAVDAMTLAVPAAGQAGQVIMIYSDSAFAHTLTCPSAILQAGVTAGNKTVATFAAFKGAGLTLLATAQGSYTVLSSTGITFS